MCDLRHYRTPVGGGLHPHSLTLTQRRVADTNGSPENKLWPHPPTTGPMVGAREMAQWFKTEDLDSVPTAHMETHNHL